MSESFCVDVAALGQVPTQLDGAHRLLATTRGGPAAAQAGRAAAPGFGAGIARFGDALDAFVAAGERAIGEDITRLRMNAAAYERCELGVVRAMSRTPRGPAGAG